MPDYSLADRSASSLDSRIESIRARPSRANANAKSYYQRRIQLEAALHPGAPEDREFALRSLVHIHALASSSHLLLHFPPHNLCCFLPVPLLFFFKSL